jgi:hypothetical protein
MSHIYAYIIVVLVLTSVISKMILSIHAQWNEEFGADIQDILQLPMFTARFVVSADDTRISPLTIGNLEALLQYV